MLPGSSFKAAFESDIVELQRKLLIFVGDKLKPAVGSVYHEITRCVLRFPISSLQ